jgi:hypothetical protein
MAHERPVLFTNLGSTRAAVFAAGWGRRVVTNVGPTEEPSSRQVSNVKVIRCCSRVELFEAILRDRKTEARAIRTWPNDGCSWAGATLLHKVPYVGAAGVSV